MVTSRTGARWGGGGWRETDEAGIRVHWLPVAYRNSMSYPQRIRAFFEFALRARGQGCRPRRRLDLRLEHPHYSPLQYRAWLRQGARVLHSCSRSETCGPRCQSRSVPSGIRSRASSRAGWSASHIATAPTSWPSPQACAMALRVPATRAACQVIPNLANVAMFSPGSSSAGPRSWASLDWLQDRPLDAVRRRPGQGQRRRVPGPPRG